MTHSSNLFLGIASSILISIGSITTINTLSYPVIGIALVIAGSIGLGLREYMKTSHKEDGTVTKTE